MIERSAFFYFTEEQLEILRKGFMEHDFTKEIPLKGENKIPDKKASAYLFLRNLTFGFLKHSLRSLGITRDTKNYSTDHPIRRLLDADSNYIAEIATDIFCDKEKTEETVALFFCMFGPLFQTATNAFCRAHSKKEDELTDEDRKEIIDATMTVILDELSSALELGQQFPALNNLFKVFQAHEDFTDKQSTDKINFHHKWTHDKTAVGAMLPLHEDDENRHGIPRTNDDTDGKLMAEEFMATLDETDRNILKLRQKGLTQQEIADVLDFQTHSAVTKRIQSIRRAYTKYSGGTS